MRVWAAIAALIGIISGSTDCEGWRFCHPLLIERAERRVTYCPGSAIEEAPSHRENSVSVVHIIGKEHRMRGSRFIGTDFNLISIGPCPGKYSPSCLSCRGVAKAIGGGPPIKFFGGIPVVPVVLRKINEVEKNSTKLIAGSRPELR